MGENRKKAESLVAQMTLEEKAGLCSGSDMWHTKSVERLGIRSIMVSDGPHGLRKQEDSQDNLGIGDSVPATCFPTASLLACSFDPSLAGKVGSAIADEAKAQQVSVLLGPGINIKRSPLCGRNFEYFSEDPIVAGKMGAGYIKGVQSKGVGTSLKHFAVNNQERRRMSISATAHEVIFIALPDRWMVAHKGTTKPATRGFTPFFFVCSRVTGMVAALDEVPKAVK